MREILSLHIGQAGLQIGQLCWDLFCLEHEIDPGRGGLRTENVQTAVSDESKTFFQSTGAGRYRPRALLIDLESTIVDNCFRSTTLRDLFTEQSIITGEEDGGNLFARAYNTVGVRLNRSVMYNLRKTLESYDNLQGFIIYHAYGGGTSSGYTSLLAATLHDQYKKKNLIEIGIFPSMYLTEAIVEPYNAILGAHNIMNNTDCCVSFDNESLFRICVRKLNVTYPTWTNINRLLAQVISSLTASLRFHGTINVNLEEMQTNLIPFPRVHYPIASLAPLTTWEYNIYDNWSINQLIGDCFAPRNQMLKCNPVKAKYMACCLLLRGDISPSDVNYAVQRLRIKRCIHFVDWCPTGWKMGFNSEPIRTLNGSDLSPVARTCCLLANTTAVKQLWHCLNCKFDLMFAKRAFVHWYLAEGMELDQFKQAREDLATLEKDYLNLEEMECCCKMCPGF